MRKVLLRTETIEALKWPICCLACGKDLSKQAATSSSNDAENAKIRKHWENFDSNHLLRVWMEQNEAEWRPETFQIIKDILEERRVAVPPGPPAPPRPHCVIQIPVKRGIRALFLSLNPKTITVQFCGECGHKKKLSRKWLEGLASWGYILAFIGMLGGFFDIDILSKITGFFAPSWSMLDHGVRQRPDLATRSRYILLFLLGGILGLIGDSLKHHAFGVMAVRISEDRWGFRFRRKEVASEFAQLNQQLVVSERA